MLVDWNLIEQVNIQFPEITSCPICICPPVAAKITKCGHIYCWSCLLHNFCVCETQWIKCPICYEGVHKDDLKSVSIKQHKMFNVGDVVTFKLMKRMKGSNVTYPATATIRNDEIFKFSDIDKIDAYPKLFVANKAEILSIIDRDEEELKVQMINNGECPENCFIQEAFNLLIERRNKVLDKDYENVGTTLKEVVAGLDVGNDAASLNISGNQPGFYYFYQASEGQHIYLDPINTRMFEHTYGSLEMSPTTISGQILEKIPFSMSEEVRKRFKYLQHLPVTSQFEHVEIKLEEPIINRETIEDFRQSVESRKKLRQKRARDEKRREKKIAIAEDRLLGKYPTPELHIESELQFPTFDRPRTESECTQPSEISFQELIITPPNSLQAESEFAGPSFAKMLSAQKSNVVKWPALANHNSAPPKLINVTGQRMPFTSFPLRNRSDSDEGDAEEFDYIPPNTVLGDLIDKAFQKEKDVAPDEGTSIKKKKQKRKQKILFTTTMAYSPN